MQSRQVTFAALAAGVLAGAVALAQNGTPINPHSNNALTVAVYGDAPYGMTPTDTTQTDKTLAFIAPINADPKVDLVLHVGDIHSGKQFCTEAYDRQIFDFWTAFKNPLIYTPGDNEWSDCHKAAEGRSRALTAQRQPRRLRGRRSDRQPRSGPLDLLPDPGLRWAAARSGCSRRRRTSTPLTRGTAYVENVMWEQSKVLFVTLNVPGGSNNDADIWFGAGPHRTRRPRDRRAAPAADLRWLDAAFAQAAHDDVDAVVIQAQADMWDLDSKPVTHHADYEPFVASIATHTAAFGKPVLMFNGDSHRLPF